MNKVPEPAVVRGLIVAVLGLVGTLLGKQFDISWVDEFITVYAVVAPAVLALWIRRHVTPVKE